MNYVNIDTKNKTKIVATKQIVENLRTNEAIRNYIISSVSEIFKDKEILKKQKVVAIKNLVKDLKVAINNDTFKYSLNLVIRNLNEYHNLQKSETKDENGVVKTSFFKLPLILMRLFCASKVSLVCLSSKFNFVTVEFAFSE